MSCRVEEQAARNPYRPLVIKWHTIWEAWTYLGDVRDWEYEAFDTHADAVDHAHRSAGEPVVR